jgi:protein transport protein SEC13
LTEFGRYDNNGWTSEVIGSHGDWVRDVAWAPNVAVGTDTIASCGQVTSIVASLLMNQDKAVKFFSFNADKKSWDCLEMGLETPVYRLSWSVAGNVVAASEGSGRVTLFKQHLDGSWRAVDAFHDVAQ